VSYRQLRRITQIAEK